MVSKKSSALLLSGALFGGVMASTYVRAETQVYNQPGTHYFTAPLGVTVKVTVIGGGGGGGGGGGALDRVTMRRSGAGGGGGGAGGGLVCSVSTASNPTFTITVGSGGAEGSAGKKGSHTQLGTSGGNGGDGAKSIVNTNDGVYSADGGSGGGGGGDGGLTTAKPGHGGNGGAAHLPENQGNNCSTFKIGGVGESGGLYGGSETPGNGGDSLGLCSNAGKGGKGGVGGIANSSSQTGYSGSPGLKGGDGCVILEY